MIRELAPWHARAKTTFVSPRRSLNGGFSSSTSNDMTGRRLSILWANSNCVSRGKIASTASFVTRRFLAFYFWACAESSSLDFRPHGRGSLLSVTKALGTSPVSCVSCTIVACCKPPSENSASHGTTRYPTKYCRSVGQLISPPSVLHPPSSSRVSIGLLGSSIASEKGEFPFFVSRSFVCNSTS